MRTFFISVFLLPLVATLLSGCSKQPDQSEPADPAISAGEAIVKANCKVCHAQGINGAPVLGNKKMWQERAQQPLELLVQHVSEGYGLMPAKGGNEELTQEDITLAVKYMLAQVNES